MGKIKCNRLKRVVASWRMGDYFRQFSIVAAGIIVTFWGSALITEHTRRKEVRATMHLVAEELEYNKRELHRVKSLLDIDIHMSRLLMEHGMNAAEIPEDTLWKYDELFNNMDEFSNRSDALDVLKGSSLMQYIPDKRMLQDVLQVYYELGRKRKDVDDYYAVKTEVLMGLALSAGREDVLSHDRSFRGEVAYLLQHDSFINFVIMVPGFLEVLRTKYR